MGNRKAQGVGKPVRCIETGEVFSSLSKAACSWPGRRVYPTAVRDAAENGVALYGRHFEWVYPDGDHSMPLDEWRENWKRERQNEAEPSDEWFRENFGTCLDETAAGGTGYEGGEGEEGEFTNSISPNLCGSRVSRDGAELVARVKEAAEEMGIKDLAVDDDVIVWMAKVALRDVIEKNNKEFVERQADEGAAEPFLKQLDVKDAQIKSLLKQLEEKDVQISRLNSSVAELCRIVREANTEKSTVEHEYWEKAMERYERAVEASVNACAAVVGDGAGRGKGSLLSRVFAR